VPPDQAPFPLAPADIGSYAPGQIVATRPVVPKAGNLADTADAGQISYRTDDSHDRAELTVTTLLVPKKAWTGAGSRSAISVQAAEDSTGTRCAPSYEVSSGSLVAASSVLFAAPQLDRGWAVAMPDFEGPKSVFMWARKPATPFSTESAPCTGGLGEWTLNGYSGGAQATGWAAELQPSYAPDVKLAGVTMGGTPADPPAPWRAPWTAACSPASRPPPPSAWTPSSPRRASRSSSTTRAGRPWRTRAASA
jgi:hypothetical protein